MRMILNAEFDTTTANQAISEGQLTKVTEQLLGFQPEAAYFYARDGRRALTVVVDVADAALLPSFAEPLWQQLNAHVQATPCMTPGELREGFATLG